MGIIKKYLSISRLLISMLILTAFIFTSTGCNVSDEEEESTKAKEIIKKYQLVIIFENNETNPNIKIVNSYKVKDDKDKKCIIKYIMENPQYSEAKRTRTASSYLKEWKSHNALYNLNMFREHTKDVDLDENGDIGLYNIFALLE